MTDYTYELAAIGNAIVDVVARCEDSFLEEIGAPKGSMQLVDAAKTASIYSKMGQATEISGGSAANTTVGFASLGGKAAFVGKVADDEFGRIFRHDIKAAQVGFDTAAVSGEGKETSRCLVLVSPDGQRTMNTFLGISTDLDQGEVDPDVIKNSKIVYLEGYLFDQPEAKEAFRQAVSIANAAGRTVALSLSDSFCVDRHRDEFLELIRSGIGVLFANEAEILSLYQTDDFALAAAKASTDTKLAALTRSEKGCVISSNGEMIEVAAEPVSAVVDTTGAGDLFAAGFLFGLARDMDLKDAGRLGGIAAAEIISHMGARPEVNLAELAKQRGLEIK